MILNLIYSLGFIFPIALIVVVVVLYSKTKEKNRNAFKLSVLSVFIAILYALVVIFYAIEDPQNIVVIFIGLFAGFLALITILNFIACIVIFIIMKFVLKNITKSETVWFSVLIVLSAACMILSIIRIARYL